ncbi:MAG TPA: AMP-binding protein [Pseudonocardiaceae bacterium]|jgi:fatty-acyl-CoA synthase|nr:AMP-binding protein [Pseudonocardiaceae bacterium]
MPAWYVTSTIDALAAGGDRTALIYRDHQISCQELLDEVYRSACVLRRRGLNRGDGLVLVAGNEPAGVVIRLAAFLLGLRFTPVVATDPDTLAHITADADPALVLNGGLDTTGVSPEPLPVQAQDDDIARVLYTGGTTGVPKGVPATYRALGASARSWAQSDVPIPAGLRFILATPFAHGSGDAALGMLGAGATLHLLDEFSPAAFVDAVQSGPVAVSYLYPSWLYRVLETGADLSSLVFLSYGSAPIAPDRLTDTIARLGTNLVQTYATTEAPAIALLSPADHAAIAEGRTDLLRSVGKPLPGVEVEIRDQQGEVGEVWVRAASVMTGYWRRPDLTAEMLVDGWLRTGDLGRIDADGYLYLLGRGYLYLLGRGRDIIIVDGHNHYATPLEDALASQPGVREAAVVGIPDDRTGEAVHAYVVGRRPTELPATPAMTVHVVAALPLTALGKVDKQRLREDAINPVSAQLPLP